MYSISEIAQKSGVSPATVSRALNPQLRHKVKPATLERILSCCEANHYCGNLAARTLASGRTYCIGLVLCAIENDFASPFLALQISGITKVLHDAGYSLKLIAVPHGSFEEVDRSVRKALHSHEVDGFLLNSTMISDETLTELKRRRIPALILHLAHIQPREYGIPSVGINNRSGFQELCAYLASHAVHSLAILGADRDDFRVNVLREEARRQKIRIGEFFFSGLPPAIPQQIHEMYLEVKRNWNALRAFPAWHCVTDLWALGALQAKEEIAPDSGIFISGYDNIEENPNYSLSGSPRINTVDPLYRRFGEMTAEILLHPSPSAEGQLHLLDSRFILRTPLQPIREE